MLRAFLDHHSSFFVRSNLTLVVMIIDYLCNASLASQSQIAMRCQSNIITIAHLNFDNPKHTLCIYVASSSAVSTGPTLLRTLVHSRSSQTSKHDSRPVPSTFLIFTYQPQLAHHAPKCTLRGISRSSQFTHPWRKQLRAQHRPDVPIAEIEPHDTCHLLFLCP